jgi:hypothetical protein
MDMDISWFHYGWIEAQGLRELGSSSGADNVGNPGLYGRQSDNDSIAQVELD